MFVKDNKIVILLENGHRHDAAEEKVNKMQGFSQNFLLRGLVHPNLGSWIRLKLMKVEIHTLSNDLK
jgi:hypothetical protein